MLKSSSKNLRESFPRCLPDSSVGKEPACNAGDLGSIPGLGRSPGEGEGYTLQYSGPDNSMDCIPRQFHGLHSPWGLEELDTPERLSLSFHLIQQMHVVTSGHLHLLLPLPRAIPSLPVGLCLTSLSKQHSLLLLSPAQLGFSSQKTFLPSPTGLRVLFIFGHLR